MLPVGLTTQVDQYRTVDPAFQRLAGVRALQIRAEGAPRDPLEPFLRASTLLELGTIYNGASSSIIDFVTEQLLNVGKMCVESGDLGAVKPRAVDLLVQTELARKWLLKQYAVMSASTEMEARRSKEWTSEMQGLIDNARSYAARGVVEPGSADFNSLAQGYTRASSLRGQQSVQAAVSATLGAPLTGLRAALFANQGADAGLMQGRYTNVDPATFISGPVVSTVGPASVPPSTVTAQSVTLQGPDALKRALDKRATDYDLGLLKEALLRVKRESQPTWILTGSAPQVCYDQASEVFAEFLGDILTLNRTNDEKRPSAIAVKGLTEQAIWLIGQIDRAVNFPQLVQLVDQLTEIAKRLKTICNVAAIMPQ
jgi:hypothetical protein